MWSARTAGTAFHPSVCGIQLGFGPVGVVRGQAQPAPVVGGGAGGVAGEGVAGAEHQPLVGGQLVAEAVQLVGGEQWAVVVRRDPPRRRDRGVRTVDGQQSSGGVRGSIESGLGEDAGAHRESRGDATRIAVEVEQAVARTAGGVEELDEGLEPDPVGDRDPACDGVFDGPGRPGVQQLLRLDLVGGRGVSGHLGQVVVAPALLVGSCGRVAVEAGGAAVQLDRAGQPGGARQGWLAAAGAPADQVAAVEEADQRQGAVPVVGPERVRLTEAPGAVPRPRPDGQPVLSEGLRVGSGRGHHGRGVHQPAGLL